MSMAFRPRPSPCSIHSRNGSQALATRWLPVGGEIGGLKSVVTSLAGFAGARRPQTLGGRPEAQLGFAPQSRTLLKPSHRCAGTALPSKTLRALLPRPIRRIATDATAANPTSGSIANE